MCLGWSSHGIGQVALSFVERSLLLSDYTVLLCIVFTAHVTGYVLIVTEMPRTGQCGGGNLAGLRECNCINITNPVSYHTLVHDLL